MSIEKVLYRATATATGGRDGRAVSSDNVLDVKLATPRELGGAGGAGTNPEQLFAAGYSACFLGALKFVAARDKVGAAITGLTGATISPALLQEAWTHLTITPDPIASSIQTNAAAAVTVGISKSVPDLTGIYDLTLLNQLLTAAGRPTVSAGGLGKE